jgi:hypothetical protein
MKRGIAKVNIFLGYDYICICSAIVPSKQTNKQKQPTNKQKQPTNTINRFK